MSTSFLALLQAHDEISARRQDAMDALIKLRPDLLVAERTRAQLDSRSEFLDEASKDKDSRLKLVSVSKIGSHFLSVLRGLRSSRTEPLQRTATSRLEGLASYPDNPYDDAVDVPNAAVDAEVKQWERTAAACYICGKRRDEPGEAWCSYPHPPAANESEEATRDVEGDAELMGDLRRADEQSDEEATEFQTGSAAISDLLGRHALKEPPETMNRMQLIRIAHAAHACLDLWAQGRGKPARLTTEERVLRDELGLDMEVFGDAKT